MDSIHEKKQTPEDLIDKLHKLRKTRSRVDLHIVTCKNALKGHPNNSHILLNKLLAAYSYLDPTDCRPFVAKAISLMEEANKNTKEEMHNIINLLNKKI